MKWFNFFTKWRPWIGIISSLIVFINAVTVEEVNMLYLGSIWGVISLLLTIIQAGMLLILYIKVKNRDYDTISYIKGMLIFEIVMIGYESGIRNLYSNSIGENIFMGIIITIFGYFVWYRTNLSYFKKRVSYFEGADENKENAVEDLNEQKLENNINIEIETTNKYCTNCGKEIKTGWKYCNYCGTRIGEVYENM